MVDAAADGNLNVDRFGVLLEKRPELTAYSARNFYIHIDMPG